MSTKADIVQRTIATLRLLTELMETGLPAPISVESWVGPRVHLLDHPTHLDPWLAALGLSAPIWEPHTPGSDLLMAEWLMTDDRPFNVFALRPADVQAKYEAAA